MSGPLSKYFEDARALRHKHGARGVFVVVIGGTGGNGACGDVEVEQSPADMRRIARALRSLADAVELGRPNGAAVYGEEKSERRN